MKTILTAHKMRFYPNKEQIQIIETTFGATLKMFNSLHAQFFERSKMSAQEKANHAYKNYTALKNTWNNDNDWLKNVAGQALANRNYLVRKIFRNGRIIKELYDFEKGCFISDN